MLVIRNEAGMVLRNLIAILNKAKYRVLSGIITDNHPVSDIARAAWRRSRQAPSLNLTFSKLSI